MSVYRTIGPLVFKSEQVNLLHKSCCWFFTSMFLEHLLALSQGHPPLYSIVHVHAFPILFVNGSKQILSEFVERNFCCSGHCFAY